MIVVATACALLVLAGAVVVGIAKSIGEADAGLRAPSTRPTAKGSPHSKPSKPKPTTKATTPVRRQSTDQQVVMANRLYKVGAVKASKCHEPAGRPTSVAGVRAYYGAFVPCLNKAWRPVVLATGRPFRSPRLVVVAGQSTATPCGPSQSLGYYCDGTIYLSAAKDIDDYRKYSKAWTRSNMAFLIGHEYGHHVQNLTGILQSSWNRQRAAANRTLALEESRRRELQASCLSMVYVGADRAYFPVGGSLRTWLRWTVYHRGDQWNPVRDHGDKDNHGFWSMRGFNSRNPASCNTFTASHKAVS